jgi:ribonucleotide reductase alpha subunit
MKVNTEILRRFSTTGESWSSISDRVTSICSKHCSQKPMKELIVNGYFVPGGQILRGVGSRHKNLFNSYVTYILNNEASVNVARRITEWTRLGCGVGVNVTEWIKTYDGHQTDALFEICSAIAHSQQTLWNENISRTATMVNVDFDIEGIEKMSKILAENLIYRHLNLSVLISDTTMFNIQNALTRGENCDDLIKIKSIAKSVWNTGNPSILFIDRINKDHSFRNEKIQACNSCAEQFLLPNEGCSLGSINLNSILIDKKIDWNLFEQCIRFGIRFLNDVIDASSFPNQLAKAIINGRRRIGLGVLGYASLLEKLKIEYDSPEAIILADSLSSKMKTISNDETITLGNNFGSFNEIDKTIFLDNRRNSNLLSIAPTGAISLIWNVSSGIEPIFASEVQKETIKVKYSNNDIKRAIEIDWTSHLDVLASWQRNIDGGISKTINLPKNASRDEIVNIFVASWEKGCKGISIFRDQSRTAAIIPN